MEHKQLSVALIGGGIGGLSAALSLLRAGVDVHVYERARTISEVGAGIAVSPNATRILHRLGLADALEGMGVKTLAWLYHRWDDGRTLLRAPLAGAVEAAFGFPLYHMHRADLVNALMRALPPERLHVGHNFKALVDHGDHIEAEFENGAHISADALVGADGRHFVHYYVRNQQLLNFVAVIAQETWTKESWTDRGEVADLLAAYEGWHPQVHGILGAVDSTFIWALFDRKPLAQWSAGRVTLLGDACHPMLPFMAQGSAQAIEDGATLAACLARIGKRDVPEALRRYEVLRLPRTSRVQGQSEANKTRHHLPDGPAQQARDAEMARGGTDFSREAVAWLYGFDAGGPEAIAID